MKVATGSEAPPRPLHSISAVERDTGLSKDTLRVWERRYHFPLPERDANGERAYTQDQVEKLRALKRLIDRGHRPSKIVGQSLTELLALVDPAVAVSEPVDPAVAETIELLRAHRVADLRQALGQRLMREGLARFCVGTVAPLSRQVGEAWMRGQLEVFEEHLFTETVQGLLRGSLASMPPSGRSPRVLLTTFPNEQHGLGLLMAESMLALEGTTCISLGTQTPIWDIVLAAKTHAADIVALSFSLAYPVAQAVEGLEELRTKLAPGVEVWAGGSNPGLARRAVRGVTVLPELDAIAGAIARWRASRGEH
jgi:DNA-binding transcriptional MerR regulator/methylmalonyl-CoA mutase cobalamin-binding subunit